MSYLEAAPIQDAPDLRRITFASKAHWKYEPEVMEAWERGYKEPSPDAFEERRVQVLRERATGIIGYYALGIPDNEEVQLTHLFVAPEHIGKGRGRELFETATRQARDMDCRALGIVSDPKAEGFYLSLGAERTGTVCPDIPDYYSPILRLDLTGPARLEPN